MRELNVLLISNVSQGNDPVDIVVVFLDIADRTFRSCDRVFERSEISGIRNCAGSFSGDSDDRQLVLLVNLIRNERRSEFGVLGVDVAGDDRELERVQEVGEQVVSIVKFVVSERHRIEAKLV